MGKPLREKMQYLHCVITVVIAQFVSIVMTLSYKILQT